MAWVKSHVMRGKNVSKLTEYNLPSQKHMVHVSSGPLSSYTNAHRAHIYLLFYAREFVHLRFQIFSVIIIILLRLLLK